MTVQLERGVVKAVNGPDAKGVVSCRVGECEVKVPRPLTGLFKEGRELAISGNVQKNVMDVLAVYDVATKKTAHVDMTMWILLGALAVSFGIAFGVFSMTDFGVQGNVDTAVFIVGMSVTAYSTMRAVQIVKAVGQLRIIELEEGTAD